MNETNQAPATGGTKLSTIFMVVLGLHIVVIVVISAFYFMKGRSHPEMADTSTPAITEGSPVITDATAQAPGNTAAEPTVDTATAPIISPEMIDTMASAEPTSPMPSASDPVWSTPRADTPEPTEAQSLVNSDQMQTPPARLDMEPKTLATPAPVKKAPVTASVSKAKTYQVAPGDNLTKIAKKNNTTVAKLKQANGLTADALKVGQTLKVPGVTVAGKTGTVAAAEPAKTPAKKSAPVVAASTPSGSSSYQVAPGDNLTKIAKKNSTTVAKLKQANGLTTDSLKVGQILKVPGSAATKATPSAAPVRETNASSSVKKPFREPVITMDMARL